MNGATESDNLQIALGKLKEGLHSLITNAVKDSAAELIECRDFVYIMHSWIGKMPGQRIRETALSLIRQIFSITSKRNISLNPAITLAMMELGPNLTISNDQMAAFITIPSDMASLWNTETVKKSLQRNRILHNLDETAIQTCFAQNQFDQMICVARGKNPIPGDDAVLEWKIKLIDNLNAEDTSACLNNPNRINYIEPIAVNQLIAIKKPSTEGIPGYDIFGNEAPTIAGINIDFPPLPNCRIEKGGMEIYSAVDGFAYVDHGKVSIVPTGIINGDVDIQSGNIQKTEGITILGDIINEVRVISEGDIAVTGYIGASTLQSGGSVFCNGGIDGKNKARIAVQKNLETFYINSATIEAGENIRTHGSILHASISARRILAETGNGHIIGGTIYAWDDICAMDIGTEMGIKTRIIMGEELPQLQEMAEKLLQARKAREQQIKKYQEIKKKLIALAEKSGMNEKINSELINVEKKMQQHEEENASLNEKAEKVEKDISICETRTRMVRARRAIYPGTVIQIMGRTIQVQEKMEASTIMFMEGKLLTVPFQERLDEEFSNQN